MKRAKKDVVRIGDTSSMYHPRGLESKEAREIYSSLEDHVAAERFRLPWLLAWVSVITFCSIHILVPAALAWFALTVVFCYRGDEVMDVVETLTRRLLDVFDMSAQAEALDELTQSDMFKQTKELVTCPESDSFVCELCKWMIPGVVGISTFSLLAILLTWPHGEWPIVVRFFQGWTDIFGFRLLIDQSKFDARKRYLIAAVPHGVVPLGSIITGAYIRQFLPSLNSTVAIASILFKMPILRQVFMWGGCIPATKSLMAKSLANEGDKVCVMSGGIAELFLSSRKREQLYLLKRRGFVRLAIETNAELVPMYIFGQTNMFDQVATSGGYMMRVSRYLSASLTYFWGQLFLPIPFSTSVTTVVGTPIPVVSPINDTEDAMLHAVEKMHAEFIASIKDLYRLHAADCGYGDKPLEIL